MRLTFVQTIGKNTRGGPEIRSEKGAEEIVFFFGDLIAAFCQPKTRFFADHETGFADKTNFPDLISDEGKIWTYDDTLWTKGQPTRIRRGDHHVLSDKSAKRLIELKPLRERLIIARINSKHAKLTVITSYAPI